MVRRIEALETSTDGRPHQPVVIIDCGQLPADHDTSDPDLVTHDNDNAERNRDAPDVEAK